MKNCAENNHHYIIVADYTYKTINDGNGRTKTQWYEKCNKIRTVRLINGLILNEYEI